MRRIRQQGLLNDSSGTLSSKDVENASFVSLDNLSLGYNFSYQQAQFSKIRLYLAGNNLFYITKYKGVDPNPRYGDIEDNYAVLSCQALTEGVNGSGPDR